MKARLFLFVPLLQLLLSCTFDSCDTILSSLFIHSCVYQLPMPIILCNPCSIWSCCTTDIRAIRRWVSRRLVNYKVGLVPESLALPPITYFRADQPALRERFTLQGGKEKQREGFDRVGSGEVTLSWPVLNAWRQPGTRMGFLDYALFAKWLLYQQQWRWHLFWSTFSS